MQRQRTCGRHSVGGQVNGKLLCGSGRNLYGKRLLCSLPYKHPFMEHQTISAGKVVYWVGALSKDIPPRHTGITR